MCDVDSRDGVASSDDRDHTEMSGRPRSRRDLGLNGFARSSSDQILTHKEGS